MEIYSYSSGLMISFLYRTAKRPAGFTSPRFSTAEASVLYRTAKRPSAAFPRFCVVASLLYLTAKGPSAESRSCTLAAGGTSLVYLTANGPSAASSRFSRLAARSLRYRTAKISGSWRFAGPLTRSFLYETAKRPEPFRFSGTLLRSFRYETAKRPSAWGAPRSASSMLVSPIICIRCVWMNSGEICGLRGTAKGRVKAPGRSARRMVDSFMAAGGKSLDKGRNRILMWGSISTRLLIIFCMSCAIIGQDSIRSDGAVLGLVDGDYVSDGVYESQKEQLMWL